MRTTGSGGVWKRDWISSLLNQQSVAGFASSCNGKLSLEGCLLKNLLTALLMC